MEIASSDPQNIVVTYYCTSCALDPKKNIWGTLYWDGLTSLYT
jgi:hypothetical protein